MKGGESIFPMIMAGRRGVERFRWPSRGFCAGAAFAASTEVKVNGELQLIKSFAIGDERTRGAVKVTSK